MSATLEQIRATVRKIDFDVAEAEAGRKADAERWKAEAERWATQREDERRRFRQESRRTIIQGVAAFAAAVGAGIALGNVLHIPF